MGKSDFFVIVRKPVKIKQNKNVKNQKQSENQIFLQVRKVARESGKPGFHVFCLFTPLFGRFRLSRVPQREELFEIYRLV